MKKKIKIAVCGALGRMGRLIIKEIQNNKIVSLESAIVNKYDKNINKEVGKVLKIKPTKIVFQPKIKKSNNFDVLIDFTTPEKTIENVLYCQKNSKKIVIGTTGFSNLEMNFIKKASKKTSILYSSNFSIGINLMIKLLGTITKSIGKTSDIEIIESHHKNKIDAPSGTAISLGKKIAACMNWNYEKSAIYDRHVKKSKRKKREIGFSSLRIGNLAGKHSVIFANNNEILKIKHEAVNRKIFSKGAVLASIWLHKQKNGLFNMQDVLKI
ncbi:4-hydroxy-tetrahydrodipicolinate reductase [Buchnera aphidicola]|uniref:4-hydroxy-tetrahydrodipicolinate reductase n=1 Tax=Buchnera aphidicola TaxID=9 RepID=UPI0030EEEFFF